MDSSREKRFLLEKAKPRLAAKKSSLTLILQKRDYIKTLKVKEDKRSPRIAGRKKQKKIQVNPLVYKVQAAQRINKLSENIYEIKNKLKGKTNQEKTPKGTQTSDQTQAAKYGNDLYHELHDFIDKFIALRLMEVMPLQRIELEIETPLVQFVIFTNEPLTGRRFAFDLTESPTRFELFWMFLLENRNPYIDKPHFAIEHTKNWEVATISKDHDENIGLSCQPEIPYSPNTEYVLRDYLNFISFFIMLFTGFLYFSSEKSCSQPISMWEWFLKKWVTFLRLYFYIDIDSY